MQIGQVAVRLVQFVCVLIVTALIGNVIDTAFAGNPASINWSMVVIAVSWIPMLYGLYTAFADKYAMPVISMALDGFAVVITFIAATVLSAKLGVHSCSNQGYTSRNGLTNGSHNMKSRCQELQAATAFYWFLFFAFIASLVMGFISGGSSSIRGGGIRRGGPSMSHV